MAEKALFTEVTDPKAIEKIFSLASALCTYGTVWFKDDSFKFEAGIAELPPDSKQYFLELPPSTSRATFEKFLEKRGSKAILLAFRVEMYSIFLNATVTGFQSPNYARIAFPDKIFRAQRRSHWRVPIKRDRAPKITLYDPRLRYNPRRDSRPNELLEYRIVDLGVGGVGFAARPDEAEYFKKGAEVHDIRFKVRGTEIITEATVARVLKTTSDLGKDMLHVGLQFKNLTGRPLDTLAKYCLDEGRKHFTLMF